jgi:hypothetical protein
MARMDISMQKKSYLKVHKYFILNKTNIKLVPIFSTNVIHLFVIYNIIVIYLCLFQN